MRNTDFKFTSMARSNFEEAKLPNSPRVQLFMSRLAGDKVGGASSSQLVGPRAMGVGQTGRDVLKKSRSYEVTPSTVDQIQKVRQDFLRMNHTLTECGVLDGPFPGVPLKINILFHKRVP